MYNDKMDVRNEGRRDDKERRDDEGRNNKEERSS